MDKKILLGGGGALLLVGNMYATPANAAIDLSIGGEVKLTAGMSECGPDAYHVSPKEFTEKYGTQRELLQKVQDELNITGCKCGCTSAFNDSFSGL